MIASRRARNRPPGRAAVGIEGPGIRSQSPSWWRPQSLAAGGASLVEMQPAGPRLLRCRRRAGQSPAMLGHYARGQLAARGAVARVRYGRG